MTVYRTARSLLDGFSIVLVVAALFGGLMLITRGVQAGTPGKWETWVVSFAKHKVFVGDKARQNPMSATPQLIAQGQRNFSHYCYACHGLDGQNTGVPFADAMSPPVPSLASQNVQSYTDGQLHWVIQNGLWPSGMPAARGILSDEEIWPIVLYVRHLPPAGSLGEPRAYNGE